MSVLCVVNFKLVWKNDIGRFLNGGEWDAITLSRSVLFPCLPPVGTTLFLECEEFNDLLVEEINFFEKSDRVGDTPAFHLGCKDFDMGTWEGPGTGSDLIKRVGGYLNDGWALGDYINSDEVFDRWMKYVDEQEESDSKEKI